MAIFIRRREKGTVMELVELFRSIEEGEFNPTISDGVVKFYYENGTYGVIPPTRPASEHYTEGLKNFVYPRTPASTGRTHEAEPGVSDAMQCGWIIPAPLELSVHSNDVPTPAPETHVDDYVNFQQGNLDERTPESVFHMNTKCIIDLPEGYSLLAVSPCNYVEHRFTVIPRVLDAGEFPQTLQVPLRIHKEKFTLEPGTPVVQVFPFKHSDYDVDATVGTFSDDELTRTETECINNSAD